MRLTRAFFQVKQLETALKEREQLNNALNEKISALQAEEASLRSQFEEQGKEVHQCLFYAKLFVDYIILQLSESQQRVKRMEDAQQDLTKVHMEESQKLHDRTQELAKCKAIEVCLTISLFSSCCR